MMTRLLRREEGSAMTEFAIMLPAMMMIMFYSVFFGDLIEVKLKTLEAARYASWESTVYRSNAQITNEITDRFANMKSVDVEAAETTHLLGLTNFQLDTQHNDQQQVAMTGGVPQDNSVEGQGNGDASLGGVDGTINTVIGWADLPTTGKARTDITFTVENQIVPDIMLMNRRIRADSNESDSFGNNTFELTSHHVVIYDTWKGWPNPNQEVGTRNKNASPASTYDTAYRQLEAQVRQIAFVKLGSFSIVDSIGKAFDFFGLPMPLDARGYTSDGPTTQLAVEGAGNGIQSFSPSRGKRNTRFGHRLRTGVFMGDNPNPSIDHSRYTLPYKISTGRHQGKTITWWHRKSGGYGTRTTLQSHQAENDYVKSYACRGHYYDGHIQKAGKPGDRNNYDGCGDSVDQAANQAQSILDRFGSGVQIPSF